MNVYMIIFALGVQHTVYGPVEQSLEECNADAARMLRLPKWESYATCIQSENPPKTKTLNPKQTSLYELLEMQWVVERSGG